MSDINWQWIAIAEGTDEIIGDDQCWQSASMGYWLNHESNDDKSMDRALELFISKHVKHEAEEHCWREALRHGESYFESVHVYILDPENFPDYQDYDCLAGAIASASHVFELEVEVSMHSHVQWERMS